MLPSSCPEAVVSLPDLDEVTLLARHLGVECCQDLQGSMRLAQYLEVGRVGALVPVKVQRIKGQLCFPGVNIFG